MPQGRQYVLVVSEDGYGKRVPVDEIRRTKGRNVTGVNLSRVPIAAALVVDRTDGEVVLMTANGKIQRIRVGDVPTRRRSDPKSGRISKGARIMRLDAGDRVATAALTGVEIVAEPRRRTVWSAGRVGLKTGEETRQTAILTRVPGRRAESVMPRDEWAQTEVHRHSMYFCSVCGAQHPDPEAVYACLDEHEA